MKGGTVTTLSRLKTLVSLIVVSASVQYSSVCFATSEELGTVSNEELAQHEALWKAGGTNKYYSMAATMVRIIVAQPGNHDLQNVAAILFGNLMSKEEGDKGVGTADLSVMEALAKYFIANDKVSIEGRRGNVRLLSSYLGRIRSERIRDFQRLPVVANVSAPAGTTGMAGMSPNAIADPVARAKYEESIRQNLQNDLTNRRQSALEKIERKISRPIIGYIIETFRAGESSSSALLSECIVSASLNDEEKKEVMSMVGSR